MGRCRWVLPHCQLPLPLPLPPCLYQALLVRQYVPRRTCRLRFRPVNYMLQLLSLLRSRPPPVEATAAALPQAWTQPISSLEFPASRTSRSRSASGLTHSWAEMVRFPIAQLEELEQEPGWAATPPTCRTKRLSPLSRLQACRQGCRQIDDPHKTSATWAPRSFQVGLPMGRCLLLHGVVARQPLRCAPREGDLPYRRAAWRRPQPPPQGRPPSCSETYQMASPATRCFSYWTQRASLESTTLPTFQSISTHCKV
mmetsp:Transcript_60538/g.132505  ORF Transcript_60538/g.132505 Transcript_60538/m.132505 type:complete len:255 (+) Transcript_60538:13-777(+)